MLPDHLLMYLNAQISCRESQILRAATILDPEIPCLPALVLYGQEATGKSLTIGQVLAGLNATHAIIKSRECITGRHLLERTVLACKAAVRDLHPKLLDEIDGKCESLSALAVQLQRMLQGCQKFVLVFDGIDHQREAQPTLLEALARLGEVILNLTVVFVVTHPRAQFLHRAGVPHIEFPPYTRAETLAISSRNSLPIFSASTLAEMPAQRRLECEEDDEWLWPRFCGAVWDSLGKGAARDVVRFRALCERLWPSFVQHIRSGIYGTRDFSRLMVRTRTLFQNEDALKESILPLVSSLASKPASNTASTTTATTGAPLSSKQSASTEQSSTKPPSSSSSSKPLTSSSTSSLHSQDLSYYTKWLLVAAYLASHNPPRTDQTFFMKSSDHHKKKKRKAGGGAPGRPGKHRAIQRKLLGPQPFVLERWLAVFHAVVPHRAPAGGADVLTQVATLTALGMVIKAGHSAGGGAGEDIGGGKWRVNVGWEFVAGLGKGLGFDVQSFLAE